MASEYYAFILVDNRKPIIEEYMNEFELRRTEQQIRDALVGTTLEWVLDEVDATIAAGVPEEKILRRTRQSGRSRRPTSPAAAAAQYETLGLQQIRSDEYEASRKGGKLVITTRIMTDQERVQVLLDALQRVLVEVPDIELEIIRTLQTAPEADAGVRSEVDVITFEPDEDIRNRRARSTMFAERMAREQRDRVHQLFVDVAREVAN